jgi:hypothetical protein
MNIVQMIENYIQANFAELHNKHIYNDLISKYPNSSKCQINIDELHICLNNIIKCSSNSYIGSYIKKLLLKNINSYLTNISQLNEIDDIDILNQKYESCMKLYQEIFDSNIDSENIFQNKFKDLSINYYKNKFLLQFDTNAFKYLYENNILNSEIFITTLRKHVKLENVGHILDKTTTITANNLNFIYDVIDTFISLNKDSFIDICQVFINHLNQFNDYDTTQMKFISNKLMFNYLPVKTNISLENWTIAKDLAINIKKIINNKFANQYIDTFDEHKICAIYDKHINDIHDFNHKLNVQSIDVNYEETTDINDKYEQSTDINEPFNDINDKQVEQLSDINDKDDEHVEQLSDINEPFNDINDKHVEQLSDINDKHVEHVEQLSDINNINGEQLSDINDINGEHVAQLSDINDINGEHVEQLSDINDINDKDITINDKQTNMETDNDSDTDVYIKNLSNIKSKRSKNRNHNQFNNKSNNKQSNVQKIN